MTQPDGTPPPWTKGWRGVLSRHRVVTIVGFVILFTLASLLLRGLVRERDVERQMSQSHATQTRIEGLFSLVQDAETGQRGYIITGDRTFLEPYEAARRRLGDHVTALEALYRDDGEQAARLDRLERQIDAKFVEMAQVIRTRDEIGPEAASAKVAEGRGKRQMDVIRAEVSGLVKAEAEIQARQNAEAVKVRQRRDLSIGLLLATLIVIVIGASRLDQRRAAAQEALLAQTAEGAARLQAVFDSAVDGIITLNPSGSIESLNRAARLLFGYETEELLRRDISRLLDIGPDHRGWFLGRLADDKLLADGFLRELPARRRDGTVFPVDVALGAMALPDGRHVVAVIRDISERRRVEAMKEEFVATVSHELRTPLTSIAGALGLLKGGAGGALPERAGRLVEIAEANSRRLIRLINDILDMEKIGSRATPFASLPLDLDRATQAAVDAMMGLADERGIRLNFRGAGNAPTILGDADRLMQVLNNLLSNAIKFSPTSGSVDVRVEAKGDVGRISVRDHGPGVPEAFQDKLFQKFAQADGSNSRSHVGTGLGLAIAKEIVERLQGEIGFSQPAGGGAMFHIDLPLAEVDQIEAAEEARFLICEDDMLTAEVIRDDLDRHGLAADVVSTASEARHALHSGRYAGLILDIHLPDSNGLTLIRALRNAPATLALPIVVISGSTAERVEARTFGVVDWLEKPIDLARLRRALLSGSGERTSAPALILHIDDDRDMREIARGLLGASGDVVFAESLVSAKAALKRRSPDLVILDVGLPDGSGLDLLPMLIKPDGRPIPTILYTAQDPGLDALPASVEAVLVKSHASLPQLARAARSVILRHATSVSAP